MSERNKYLCVGHCCHDKVGDKFVLGGTASYSSMLAKCLGSDSLILTSFGDDFLYEQEILDRDIVVHNVAADRTTIFENKYDGGNRTQTLLARAEDIKAVDFKKLKPTFDIVHLCPIDDEVSFDILKELSQATLTLATPQGWLRQWDEKGKVSYKELDWSLLSSADFVIISDEDIPELDNRLSTIRSQIDKLIVTKGEHGATIYFEGQELHFPAFDTNLVDPTGAGDSFATGFITKYAETKDIKESMIYANCLSSICIENEGTLFFNKVDQVDKRVEEYKSKYEIN